MKKHKTIRTYKFHFHFQPKSGMYQMWSSFNMFSITFCLVCHSEHTLKPKTIFKKKCWQRSFTELFPYLDFLYLFKTLALLSVHCYFLVPALSLSPSIRFTLRRVQLWYLTPWLATSTMFRSEPVTRWTLIASGVNGVPCFSSGPGKVRKKIIFRAHLKVTKMWTKVFYREMKQSNHIIRRTLWWNTYIERSATAKIFTSLHDKEWF